MSEELEVGGGLAVGGDDDYKMGDGWRL